MQIRTPLLQIRDGDFPVRLNNHNPDEPFAVIEAGTDPMAAIILDSVEDCDRLARAVAESRRLLAEAQTDHAIAADVDEQIRRDGEALGHRIAADEGIEPKADRVPWPTGLCGHPVPPGAWAAGYTRCRDCTAALVPDPENLARFDEAAAPDLTVVDDEDGPQ